MITKVVDVFRLHRFVELNTSVHPEAESLKSASITSIRFKI